MAGWRVGFALGNKNHLADQYPQDHIYVSLFGGIQAAATALTSPQDCVKALVARYQSRRDVFYSALSEIGWEAQNQLAPFSAGRRYRSALPRYPLPISLLEEAKVAVAPGVGFGDHGEGYVRVGLLAPKSECGKPPTESVS